MERATLFVDGAEYHIREFDASVQLGDYEASRWTYKPSEHYFTFHRGGKYYVLYIKINKLLGGIESPMLMQLKRPINDLDVINIRRWKNPSNIVRHIVGWEGSVNNDRYATLSQCDPQVELNLN